MANNQEPTTVSDRFWHGDYCSKTQHFILTFGLSATTTILMTASVTFNCWDYTNYDIRGITNEICLAQFQTSNCNSSGSSTKHNRFTFLTKDNSSVWPTAFRQRQCRKGWSPVERTPVIYYDHFSTRCSNSPNYKPEYMNASILLPEQSGIWKVCKMTEENPEGWALVQKLCPGIRECYQYTEEIEGFCCNGVCPYSHREIIDLNEHGRTTREVINTAVSSNIVTWILQIASYIAMIITWTTHYVTITRMTGISIMLSGLFLCFSLTMNHYKIFLMTRNHKGLPYLPVEMSRHRMISIGWGMWVGWLAVLLSVLAFLSWIVFSRFYVNDVNREERERSQSSRKESVRNRPKSSLRHAISGKPRQIASKAKHQINVLKDKAGRSLSKTSANLEILENGSVGQSRDRIPSISVEDV